MRVHPRVCGGSGPVSPSDATKAGASPRVRGKRASGPPPSPPRRCIPACAGEAAPDPRLQRVPAVHPRVCGGSGLVIAITGGFYGASPRVRGKHDAALAPLRACRCIPACAGEARVVRPPPSGGGGASPRVRGKLSMFFARPVTCGCIPACAGEARSPTGRIRRASVHPRVCGGSRREKSPTTQRSGASPRVRGKPPLPYGLQVLTGCIPACAGEARCMSIPMGAGGVHPRVCGGSTNRAFSRRPTRGASPRVRGKRQKQRDFPRHTGCIPACAGEATGT